MAKMTIRDIEVSGKRVFVRADFNVPLDEKKGTITDDSRIRATLPTINYLIDKGAKVILASHLGRPDGKVVASLRLAPVGQRLAELLGRPVTVLNDCIGPEVEKAVASLANGQVILLENLRFHAEEEAGTPAFAQALAHLADIFVNDAFGTAHRPHASVSGIAAFLTAVAGFLMEKEIEMLGGLLEKPARPFAALLGGAKISDKIGLIENIMGKIDYLLIGGGMAATFLKARSYEVGKSLLEPDRIATVLKLMDGVLRSGAHLLLPEDVVVSDRTDGAGQVKGVPIQSIPPDMRVVDIGPQTVSGFTKAMRQCRTVFWNGPMGIYEVPQFAAGTQAMAKVLAGLKATTVIGGGSTAEAVADRGLAAKMTFVSTGGGASLSFLGGERLPGVEVLLDKKGVAGGY
ncbi:MAG: phosphoglycerate kinase [Chloroflexi bacterium]|nr:phosphoglycerate kinase [Chloroflexota bacterium]